jgi:16S rRNA (guanine(527)-N(7))-methyltransferase RsmG
VFADLLRERFAPIGELTAGQLAQLQKHYELLVRWNQRLNLTSLADEAEIVERHYCESLFLAIHLPPGVLSVADVGSGAGFPGFPVAIFRPACQVTLIESHQRKAVFLREASRDVSNVRILAKRAEDVQDRFDFAISRAVRLADIRDTIERLAPNRMVLAGEAEPIEKTGIEWQKSIRLPWGEHRVLLVSRETHTANRR